MESNKGMTLNEYQKMAMTTCLPSCENDMYMIFGLVEEVGELAGKISKAVRKDKVFVEDNNVCFYDKVSDAELFEINEQIKSEISDIMWMTAGLARQFGWTLEEVAQYNLDKLAKRKESGTIVTHTDH